MHAHIDEFTLDDLAAQEGTLLPARHLMQTLTVSVTVSLSVSGLPTAPALPV